MNLHFLADYRVHYGYFTISWNHKSLSPSLSLSLSLVAVVVMVDGDAWTFSHSKYHNTNRYYLGLSVHPQ